MRRIALLAALLLPLAWFAGTTWRNERLIRQGSEWRIPVVGADPRDLLRGRFIAFAYDWRLAGDARLCSEGGCDLCLGRDAGGVSATIAARPAACAARVDVARSRLEFRPPVGDDLPARFSGRIFVSESRAPELDAQLGEGPLVVVATLAPDGRLINRRLEAVSPAP